jgi:hypothetical protein
MPWVAFEPTIPAFERTKTVRALDRAATVMGIKGNAMGNYLMTIENGESNEIPHISR